MSLYTLLFLCDPIHSCCPHVDCSFLACRDAMLQLLQAVWLIHHLLLVAIILLISLMNPWDHPCWLMSPVLNQSVSSNVWISIKILALYSLLQVCMIEIVIRTRSTWHVLLKTSPDSCRLCTLQGQLHCGCWWQYHAWCVCTNRFYSCWL